MEEFFQVVLLGAVQGITEFLPISSSGHLVFFQWLLGKENFGLSFDVALHFGTFLAIVLFFGKDYWQILKSAGNYLTGKNRLSGAGQLDSQTGGLFWAILVATIPAAMAGLFLEQLAENQWRVPWLVSFNLAFWGILLFVSDLVSSKKETQKNKGLRNISFKTALVVGVFQAFALMPGVSRSGSTITAGLLLGLSREDSARFSFLISGPIILGAALLKLPDLFNQEIQFSLIFVGIFSAALSGYLAIGGFLNFIKKRSLAFFMWYRLILAAVILGIWFLR